MHPLAMRYSHESVWHYTLIGCLSSHFCNLASHTINLLIKKQDWRFFNAFLYKLRADWSVELKIGKPSVFTSITHAKCFLSNVSGVKDS